VEYLGKTLASRPADEEHPYGHTQSAYFSRGVEDALIVVAALISAVEAVPRLHPHTLEQVGLDLAFSTSGAVINGVLAWFMLPAGKQQPSIGRHCSGDEYVLLASRAYPSPLQ
jgi:divalent metal cation (Fe/Co/Zn/Cd) transporter